MWSEPLQPNSPTPISKPSTSSPPSTLPRSKSNEKTIVSEALASEVETIQWSKQNPPGGLFNFGRGVGLLDESPEARGRIETWLAFERVDQ